MVIQLLLGCATVFVTMSIQIAALVYMLQYLFRVLSDRGNNHYSKGKTTYVISMIMTMLFVGHMIQVAIWAVLFMSLGEFSDFLTAFYHSMVNFASLGYGDIVMSEDWRLLGAIEASNGVLMFGLSAGAMLSIMSYLLSHDRRLEHQWDELKNQKEKNN
jgi:hypothetical protein